jgi:IMP dehydrogenase/GMP reductase
VKPVVLEALQEVEAQHGFLGVDEVLEAARDEKNPLHAELEWDDAVAADEHRKDQIRGLIRTYRVTFITADQEKHLVRGYVSVRYPQEGNRQVYVRTTTVLADHDLRQQMLADLHRDIGRLSKKYSALEEFSQVLHAAAIEAGK